MKIDVVDLSNQKLKDIDLAEDIFNIKVKKDIIARVVKWQLAKRRSGNHKVKNRAEVKHTTRKPFKQKGTGRARQGMTSVPNMRGGGIAFGPVVRDHSHKLQKKVRALGLKCAISAKVQSGDFIVMSNLDLDSFKTAELKGKLEKMSFKSVLFVDSTNNNDKFMKASSNIINVDLLPICGINVYDILKHDKLVLTESAIQDLTERFNANK